MKSLAELKFPMKSYSLIRNTILVRYKLNDDRNSMKMSLYTFRKLIFSLTHAYHMRNNIFRDTWEVSSNA